MAEYIEREAIIERIKKEWAKLPLSETTGFAILMRVLTSTPAADVRPVVLCRDCKHNKGAKVWRFLELDDVTADCSAGHGYPPMDWFCADGKKREEG